jgi:hypothetical protein
MKRHNSCDSHNTKLNRLNKIFGVGLKGAGISIVILLLANFINQKLDGPTIISHSIFRKSVGKDSHIECTGENFLKSLQ